MTTTARVHWLLTCPIGIGSEALLASQTKQWTRLRWVVLLAGLHENSSALVGVTCGVTCRVAFFFFDFNFFFPVAALVVRI